MEVFLWVVGIWAGLVLLTAWWGKSLGGPFWAWLLFSVVCVPLSLIVAMCLSLAKSAREVRELKGSAWRGKEPTDRQMDFIDDLAAERGVDYELPSTRGEASDLISKLKAMPTTIE